MAGDDVAKGSSKGGQEFGSCCVELKEAMNSEDFEPLITVSEDGVLYMSVGLIDVEDEEDAGMVDHPMFFCPFCGTKLQSPEEIRAKSGLDDDDD